MLVVICYDIVSDRRRYRVARWLEGHGERVQESVFECHLDRDRLRKVQSRLATLIDPATDRVRYYLLCGKDAADVRFDGLGSPPRDVEQHGV